MNVALLHACDLLTILAFEVELGTTPEQIRYLLHKIARVVEDADRAR